MRQADDPGQEPGRPHVGAGQAHPRKEKGDLGALRRDPDVAGRRDHGPRTGHGPIERRHDRAATLANGKNEIAGEPGELEQPRGIPREQRADDVLDVSAGAEGPAGAGDDDGANAGLGVERAEGVPELGVDLEGERVEPLGPVERDGRDGARRVDGVEERFGIRRPSRHPREIHHGDTETRRHHGEELVVKTITKCVSAISSVPPW